MATIFVSRHAGAITWARRHLGPDRVISHLDPATVEPGDRVMGTLPVHLASDVCARGAEYWHLSLDVTEGHRGHALSAEDLERLGARMERYDVIRVTEGDHGGKEAHQ